jgi:hypothetical protein
VFANPEHAPTAFAYGTHEEHEEHEDTKTTTLFVLLERHLRELHNFVVSA